MAVAIKNTRQLGIFEFTIMITIITAVKSKFMGKSLGRFKSVASCEITGSSVTALSK